jgi:flagellar transcriptional activator FlhC
MSMDTLNRYTLAMDLLALKARVSIVSKETGLSSTFLRKAFVEIHHRSPSKGSIKLSPEFINKSCNLLKEATLYIYFFHVEKSHKFSRRSINAYRRYSSYIRTVSNSEPLLDFSSAWAISKWTISGQLKLVRCSHCRSVKLINIKLQHNRCCVCKQ